MMMQCLQALAAPHHFVAGNPFVAGDPYARENPFVGNSFRKINLAPMDRASNPTRLIRI
jgi:hypothetical protein